MDSLQFYQYELSGWRGLNTLPNVADKDLHMLEDCQNVDFDDEGIISKRRGTVAITTSSTYGRANLIYDYKSQVGFATLTDNHRILVARSTSLQVLKEDLSIDEVFTCPNAIHYGVTSDNGACYLANENGGEPKILAYINSIWSYSGFNLIASTFSGTIYQYAGGGFPSGSTASVIYTYIDNFGNESNESPSASCVILGGVPLALVISGATTSIDPTVKTIAYYVKVLPAITDYQLAGTVSNSVAGSTQTLTFTSVDELSSGTLLHESYEDQHNAKYIAIYNNSLVIAGAAVLPDEVQISTPSFQRQFDANSYVRVTTGDGQPIKGFAKYLDFLTIGKSRSYHIGTGEDDTTFRTKVQDSEYGLLGQPSMLGTQKKFVFFSEDGIYAAYANSISELSKDIRTTIRGLNKANLNVTPPKQFSAAYKYIKKLLFSVREASGAGENDAILLYNYERDSWTRYKGIEAVYLACIQNNQELQYLWGGDSVGNIYLFSLPGSSNLTNSDHHSGTASAISSYAETVWINLPRAKGIENWTQSRVESTWLKLYVGGEPAAGNSTISLTTKVYTDFSSTVRGTFSTTHNAAAYPAFTCDPKTIKALSGGFGTYEWIKLRFENNNLDEHFKIHKVVFGFRVRPAVES